jgi:seryl-tRNA synthetase
MSKDFDDILKQINKSNKDLHSIDNNLSKDLTSIKTDISLLKRELKGLNNKIDLILDILNNLSIMVLDEEDEDGNLYDTDQTWVPEDEDDLDEKDDWSNHEDES